MAGRELTDVDIVEVEIEKLGNVTNIQLLISTIRGARGRKKLVGEAVAWDSQQPHIYFKVAHATDLEDLVDRFIKQLIHRGYVPKRSRRSVKGRFQEWNSVEVQPHQLRDHEEAKTPMAVEE